MTAAEMLYQTTQVSNCLNRCLNEGAIVAGCLSQWDTDCTCTSPAFRDALQKCLTDSCTPDDITGTSAMELTSHTPCFVFLLPSQVRSGHPVLTVDSARIAAGEVHKERCGTAPSTPGAAGTTSSGGGAKAGASAIAAAAQVPANSDTE
ncbi:hypothetical protein N7539_005595 [Penicillium diatomitis]|uniref:CFEM domain-containing protein n=1 Tax=Penicillium diatomitis TaxID=2819901 RepID=A0A9W9X792_9EURO|nr:uncharacterized protein N7539_005595 [Penicillium diatomitis]KAJ5485607.1 hypothetical protein N7539_005595 [Penicillium diatomitis]